MYHFLFLKTVVQPLIQTVFTLQHLLIYMRAFLLDFHIHHIAFWLKDLTTTNILNLNSLCFKHVATT